MRKLIFILLLIPFVLSAQDIGGYYVATDGSDAANGSFATPWLTWEHGIEQLVAGDTLYIRGGVYYTPRTDGFGIRPTFANGTASDTIKIWNYPGESPILDFDNVTGGYYNSNTGLVTYGNYLWFKGLTVRNVWSWADGVECNGWKTGSHENVLIENCKVYNIHGGGFKPTVDLSTGSHLENLKYLNCDAWNCCDSLATAPSVPGNKGTGFGMIVSDTTSTIYYEDCRAWLCGDQGFSGFSSGYVEYDGCYSFRNGMLEGGGHGFKMGYVQSENAIGPNPDTNKYVYNSVAAYNRWSGFTTNDNGREDALKVMVVNNIAYYNGYQGYSSNGFEIYNSDGTQAIQEKRRFYNNLSYDNDTRDLLVGTGAYYTHSHNVKGDGVWDLDIPITNADFVSVDSTGLTAARQADGSLPDNQAFTEFLHLAPTSGLIDQGTDVGLDFNGTAPDLGPFEYVPAAAAVSRSPISFGSGGIRLFFNGKYIK